MLIKQGERLINARNWNELVKPDQILRDEDTASSTHGKFVCEPLERDTAPPSAMPCVVCCFPPCRVLPLCL